MRLPIGRRLVLLLLLMLLAAGDGPRDGGAPAANRNSGASASGVAPSDSSASSPLPVPASASSAVPTPPVASPAPAPSASPPEPSALPASPAPSAPTALQSPPLPSSETEDEIDRLIASMTLEQKVGQLLMAGIDGVAVDPEAREMIAGRHIGGIILYKNNFSDLPGSARFINDLKRANEGNPAPLFIGVDQEGGRVGRLPAEFAALPGAAAVGRTNDAEIAKEMGALLAAQLQALGLNVNFAPVLDIHSNPANPVIGTRSFGNNAELVVNMGIAVMNGLQAGGVISVVKHFPGHGDTSVDSHVELPVVDKTAEQLEALEWKPFRAAVDAGADAVMVGHLLFPQIDPDAPASLSDIILDGRLRGALRFDGVIVTDDMTMGAIANHYGVAEAAVLSIEAGSDIVLVAHGYDTARDVYDSLLHSVRTGRIAETRIDESVRRIVSLKRKYELSDSALPVPELSDLPNAAVEKWRERLNAGKR